MAIRISGTTVIDNGRNILGVEITASTSATFPSGTTAERPSSPGTGSIRYNTDIATIEYYNGTAWFAVTSYDASIRGLFGGLVPSTYVNTIEYINISSTGNSADFGDLTRAHGGIAACASTTRGLFGGGATPSAPNCSNVIDYVTIATTGNAVDFGDLVLGRQEHASCSSSTRGIWAGGVTPGFTSAIDFVTIASIGNATNFGNLTFAHSGFTGCSSPTRGIFAGAFSYPGSPTAVQRSNVIEYITIASAGNAINFGDLLLSDRYIFSACASSTRGVFGGGARTAPFLSNVIDYITIASTGNSTDFGYLTSARRNPAACSNSARGVWGGGYNPTRTSVIDYITIPSTGNALNFGVLTTGCGYGNSGNGACSSGHGGLQ